MWGAHQEADITGRKVQYWLMPPAADAECAAAMDEELETYERPYEPAMPVVWMDE